MKRVLLILALIFVSQWVTFAQTSEPKLQGYLAPDGSFVTVETVALFHDSLIAKYLQMYSSAPTCSRKGQLYYDTTLNKSRVCVATGAPGTWETHVSSSSGSITPGGSDTQVQFNDSSAFGGDSAFVFNKTTNVLTLGDATTGDAVSITPGAAGAGTTIAALSSGADSSIILTPKGTGGVGIGGNDVLLKRDAANTLAQRNGTNAQAFRLYNTYTDASNYERLDIRWVSNVIYLSTMAGGTGTARTLSLNPGNGASLEFGSNGSTGRWVINNSGHFLTGTDNTYDIGASGANRPRNVFIAGTVNVASFTDVNVLRFGTGSRTRVSSASDGVLLVDNNGGTDFSHLQFGGTTSSFPALKRSTTTLEVKLADDSAYSRLAVNGVNLQGVTIANLPGTPVAGMTAYVTDGDGSLAWGDTVINSGAGATKYLVWFNGTNWTVVGK